MPLASFALLVGATPKWCRNALHLLGRPTRYDLPNARRLALTREIHATLGVPLSAAWQRAEEVLGAHSAEAPQVVAIVVDLPRFLSTWGLRLAALRAAPPRGRGRPAALPPRPRTPAAALERARHYGLDLGALRAGLLPSMPARLIGLDGSQRLVAALRP